MKPMFQTVMLSVLEINPVAARISVTPQTSDAKIAAECFEVGMDGSQPDSPVAVAGADLVLRIGTPFLWAHETHPRYAIRLAVESTEAKEHYEIQFGFNADGQIVITEELRKINFAPALTNPDLPSLFVVGDSTAFSNGRNQRGWGDELGVFFDPKKINVLNRARPGRSTRSFRSEGLWSRVLAEMKAGDMMLLQFGHNDADKVAEGRCRGVLPGIGEETETVTMPDGTREIVHTFGWYLRQFIAETRSKGATPVLLSLTVKNIWNNGKIIRRQGDYGDWSATIGSQCGVAFIEVAGLIADRYDALGRENVQPLFCSATDNVHTSTAGAKLNAECVAGGLRYDAKRQQGDAFDTLLHLMRHR